MPFARLKPFNGKQHKLRVYTVYGIKFMEQRGWYEVDQVTADYVRTVKQIQDSPDSEFSADAFDVVNTLAEAQALDKAEQKRAERAKAEHAYKAKRPHPSLRRGEPRASAGDMTTSDLKGEAATKQPRFDDQSPDFDDSDMAGKPPTPVAIVDPEDAEQALLDAAGGDTEVDGGEEAEAAEPTEETAPAAPQARRGRGRR